MTQTLKWIYIFTAALIFSLQMPSLLLSKEKENKDPVEITSDRMRSEDGGLKIIFSGTRGQYGKADYLPVDDVTLMPVIAGRA